MCLNAFWAFLKLISTPDICIDFEISENFGGYNIKNWYFQTLHIINKQSFQFMSYKNWVGWDNSATMKNEEAVKYCSNGLTQYVGNWKCENYDAKIVHGYQIFLTVRNMQVRGRYELLAFASEPRPLYTCILFGCIRVNLCAEVKRCFEHMNKTIFNTYLYNSWWFGISL